MMTKYAPTLLHDRLHPQFMSFKQENEQMSNEKRKKRRKLNNVQICVSFD